MNVQLPLHKLCFAHLIESDGPGGAERMLASVATELQAAGTRNVVIAPAGGEGWLARELKGTGVRVESFRLTRPLSPAFAHWLEATLRRHRVDLAHSHEFTMSVYGAWAARRARIPHLFTMHGGRYYAARWRRRIALRVAAELSGGRRIREPAGTPEPRSVDACVSHRHHSQWRTPVVCRTVLFARRAEVGCRRSVSRGNREPVSGEGPPLPAGGAGA